MSISDDKQYIAWDAAYGEKCDLDLASFSSILSPTSLVEWSQHLLAAAPPTADNSIFSSEEISPDPKVNENDFPCKKVCQLKPDEVSVGGKLRVPLNNQNAQMTTRRVATSVEKRKSSSVLPDCSPCKQPRKGEFEQEVFLKDDFECQNTEDELDLLFSREEKNGTDFDVTLGSYALVCHRSFVENRDMPGLHFFADGACAGQSVNPPRSCSSATRRARANSLQLENIFAKLTRCTTRVVRLGASGTCETHRTQGGGIVAVHFQCPRFAAGGRHQTEYLERNETLIRTPTKSRHASYLSSQRLQKPSGPSKQPSRSRQVKGLRTKQFS